MGNGKRLIISVVLLFVFWFMTAFASSSDVFGVILAILFLVGGIWSLIEGIIFVRDREKRDALPLALMALFLALFALFIGVGGIATSIFDLVEGGPFQGIGFLFYFAALMVFPILGFWAIIKGILLIRSKINVKLGIASLIIGAILGIPALIFLIGLIISLVRGPSLESSIR